MCIYIYITILNPHAVAHVGVDPVHLGFRNGTLERRYSRIMLSRPQNTKS